MYTPFYSVKNFKYVIGHALLCLGPNETPAAALRDQVVCSTSCTYYVYARLLSCKINIAKRPANIYISFVNTHYKEVICIVSMQIEVVNTKVLSAKPLCRNRCSRAQDDREADTVTPKLLAKLGRVASSRMDTSLTWDHHLHFLYCLVS